MISSFKAKLMDEHSPQRILAGRLKFVANQTVANRAVPLARTIRRIDAPIADGNLFVLAHPRSGSTMLSHILQSHEEITGFGEHHVSYASMDDATKLDARNAFFTREVGLHTRYSLDKLVWNQHSFADEVLRASNTRYFFLIRRPEETFESYRRVLPGFKTDADRLRSYRNRINGMIETLERIDAPERCFFATYEDLTRATDATLSTATEWLGLNTPLSADYDLTSKTGSQSWGDPSKNIQAGTVLRLDASPIEIDLAVREEADELYARAIEVLRHGSYGAAKTSAPPIIDLTTPPASSSSIQSSERVADPSTR